MPLISIDKRDLLELIGQNVPDDELAYTISMMGTDLREITDIIDVEIFPDRPDLLSTEGFAMALEGYLKIKRGLPNFEVTSGDHTARIDERVKPIRPYAVCAIVKDVELSDGAVKSLMQVQEKLHITHGRNRKKVAIGVHDLEKIEFPVTYTARPKDFSFMPLEWYTELTMEEILLNHKKGIEYAHLLEGFSEYPLWIDNKGTVLSMPPIINSEDTKVEEDTHNLFLDVTGYSRKALEQALNILVCSLARRGGHIYSVLVHEGSETFIYPRLTPGEIELDFCHMNTWLGLTLQEEQVRELLERMRYSISGHTVKIPPYRADILHPVDIIEDIAKAYGIDKIPEEIPEISTIGEEDPLEVFARKIAQLMVGFGLLEVKNYYLTSKEFFEKTRIQADLIEMENALTSEYNALRNCLLPGMLSTLSCNKHHEYPQMIFEIGEVITPCSSAAERTREDIHLAALISHPRASFTEIKEILKALLENLGIRTELESRDDPTYIPSRCGSIMVKKEIGVIGEIHPEVLLSWELEQPVTCFELNLSQLYPI
ncbi:MAG: phenylalanine--tRNA ligase subunit beta [Theionarchaea archaeon]|nr:phenylalanine--tRNA ligase subunit beta [Theionarchaea archaeon]